MTRTLLTPLKTPLKSMVDRLRATGVYRAAETDLIYCELCAYHSALAVLQETLTEWAREAFLTTAESWGLDAAERRFGLDGTGLSAEERRKRLLCYARSLAEGGTASAISALLEALGCAGSVVRDGDSWYVRLLGVLPDGYTEGDLLQRLQNAAPANTQAALIGGARPWQDLDGNAETWDAIDAQGLSWDQLDSGA